MTASGTIALPKGTKGTPVVSVSWVDSATSTAYARAVHTVTEAAPGATAKWKVETDLAAPAGTTVRCVLGAVIPKEGE
ncbi:hypothetical protein GCM10027406_13780 [Leifsonia lichenia]